MLILFSTVFTVFTVSVEVVVDVSPTVRPCPRCGQSMVIKRKKDSSGSVLVTLLSFCYVITFVL